MAFCVKRSDDLKSLTLLRTENLLLFFFVNGILLKLCEVIFLKNYVYGIYIFNTKLEGIMFCFLKFYFYAQGNINRFNSVHQNLEEFFLYCYIAISNYVVHPQFLPIFSFDFFVLS